MIFDNHADAFCAEAMLRLGIFRQSIPHGNDARIRIADVNEQLVLMGLAVEAHRLLEVSMHLRSGEHGIFQTIGEQCAQFRIRKRKNRRNIGLCA
ncbi:hypothetical protein SDC9_179273 [bioreactor metagenome]|uniref:Uncharacterized protein n=1 Tax=bioreactor metagenome TaxID=1076179 RepID=A0A645GYJ2_9ZZZZ